MRAFSLSVNCNNSWKYREDQEGTGILEGSYTNGQEEMAGEDNREYPHQ